MSGQSIDPWATNLPYIVLTAAVTGLNYGGTIAGALAGLKDAGTALLIAGVIVTIGLELAGYDRDFLRAALFGPDDATKAGSEPARESRQ